jgi:HD-GYP domain-containing protein (c-di-GMP phosphodiesterase class II)
MPKFSGAAATGIMNNGSGLLDREPLPPETADQVISFLSKLYSHSGTRRKTDVSYDALSTLVHNMVDQLTWGVPRVHRPVVRSGVPYIHVHVLNVAILVIEAGRLAGFGNRLFDLGLAALTHDLGMTQVPKQAIERPGPLTEAEWTLVKGHPEASLREMEEWPLVSAFSKIAILQHHERCDGSGYPVGKTCPDIHPYARLLAGADVLSALLMDRPYRRRMGVSEALAVLKGMAGKALDGEMIELLGRSLVVE